MDIDNLSKIWTTKILVAKVGSYVHSDRPSQLVEEGFQWKLNIARVPLYIIAMEDSFSTEPSNY